MSSTTRCPHCNAAFSVPETAVGRAVKCKQCGSPFTIALEPAATASAGAARAANVPPPLPRPQATFASGSTEPLGAEVEDPDISRFLDKLVVRIGVDLPPVCLKTNEPTTTTLKRKFSWHSPEVFLALLGGPIIYLIVAVCVSKRVTLEVPMTESLKRKRTIGIMTGFVVFLFALFSIIYGGVLINRAGLRNEDLGAGLMLAGLIAIVVALSVSVYVSSLTPRVTKIDAEYIWLKGVNKNYLDRLPEF